MNEHLTRISDDTLQLIRTSLHREIVIDILSSIGYEVKRDFKFFLRPDERRASASIKEDGYIKDFGDGWGGDIIALLQDHRQMTFRDAVQFVADHLNIETNSHTTVTVPAPINRPPAKPRPVKITIAPEQIAREFNYFETINIHDPDHYKELLQVTEPWLMEQANPNDWKLFHSMSRYDRQLQIFVTGCYTSKHQLISFKHRRNWKNDKWTTRKDTHPNDKAYPRIYTEDQPIFIVEGHRDCLNAILLGLDFIMLPTASYRDKDSILKQETTNRDIIFLVEDNQAYKAMRPLAEEIAQTAQSVRLKNYIKDESKTDLSDYIKQFSNKKEVLDALAQ